MTTVAVIDYGMGNLHSVSKALEKVSDNDTIVVSSDARVIEQADRVVLPGVGAMRDCMGEIRRLGLVEVIRRCAASKPFLGVCVGMQALLDFSDENEGVECLGILPGRVQRFAPDLTDLESGERLKIPHMGWNQVHQQIEHPMWTNITQDERFYFVHSYYAVADNKHDVAATTSYGIDFTAAVAHDNVFATQFHPEKSQHAGLQLYANFLRWNGE